MSYSHAFWTVAAVGGIALGQSPSVIDSKHNLSATGPGTIRAVAEDEVCIFCHTPHNSAPIRPLWNRAMPVDAYTIYASRSLDAQPGQPTGTSKMCLSCHDGTIAIGTVISRSTPISMSGGIGSIPQGSSNLGTVLSDDHPISFRYDGALSARDPHIRTSGSLPPEILLDSNQELQCTSCHDAHNNSFGKFLVIRNETSQLCVACHQVGPTSVVAHQNCGMCHAPHSAPSGPYLLSRATIGQTCLSCHDGTVTGAADIATDVHKSSSHDTNSPVDPPAPLTDHASCVDCHDGHTMGHGTSPAPSLPPNFGSVSGMSAAGTAVATASAEFEVCFKCHADGNTGTPIVPRVIAQNNTRLEFGPSAVSFHPVEGPGRNGDVPSLTPAWTTSSVMNCSDCHASDTSPAGGGSGPAGTHGSAYSPLLIARYDTFDSATESAQAYALCYTCHNRANILSDVSFKEHRKHIVDERTPCSACHDSHGIASSQGTANGNSNLINFDASIVRPNNAGQLNFLDLGLYRGECNLRCHGENHSHMRY
jgi:predicted CXXCH cytochrome family protein